MLNRRQTNEAIGNVVAAGMKYGLFRCGVFAR